MRYAISYQHCVEPDYETLNNRMIVAIAEWIHDGMDADDVRIDAYRIAHKVNQAWGGRRELLGPSDVAELAEQAVHYRTHGELPE